MVVQVSGQLQVLAYLNRVSGMGFARKEKIKLELSKHRQKTIFEMNIRSKLRER